MVRRRIQKNDDHFHYARSLIFSLSWTLGRDGTGKGGFFLSVKESITCAFVLVVSSFFSIKDLANHCTVGVPGSLQRDMGATLNCCTNVRHTQLGNRVEAILSRPQSFVLLRFGETPQRAAHGMDEIQLVSCSRDVVSISGTGRFCVQAKAMVLSSSG